MSTQEQPKLPASTDVLIVGAGPSGLALATVLARAGVNFVLLDRLERAENTSRAAVIHAHTLDVLDEFGMAGPLVAHGRKIPSFAIRERDRVLIGTRFDALPTRHPYLLMLPQDQTEAILERGLRAAGGRLYRGHRVESVAQRSDGAEAVVVAGAQRQVIAARYVVGADGMRSIVREAAGIAFIGEAYAGAFILADVNMRWGQGRDEVSLFFSPAGLVVVAPLPNGAFRIVATVEDAPERPDRGDVQALLDARGPTRGAATVESVIWSSRFRLHHRLAERYRADRLILVGDAAHVHSPAGGQGMNTGLVDACVLGGILSEVVAGRRAAADLDEYQRLRRPAAARVLGLADRLTRAATMRGGPQRMARNVVLRAAGKLAFVRRRMAMNLAGLSHQDDTALPRQSR
jgi:2-polyprenyl-6-methoxyphenol hydroxylase-like FAD-dependent oxidoreductase